MDEHEKNYEVFLRELDDLRNLYPDHTLVAYYAGSRVAVGKDSENLLEHIPEELKGKSLLIQDLKDDFQPKFRRPYRID